METELGHPDAPDNQPQDGGHRSPVVDATSVAGEDPSPESSVDSPESSIDDVERLLDEVERALGRLDDGTYGQCGTCGEPIDDARLADAPTGQRCDDCAAPAST